MTKKLQAKIIMFVIEILFEILVILSYGHLTVEKIKEYEMEVDDINKCLLDELIN